MSGIEQCRGHAVVLQPDEGLSYWQPVPANGYADPKLVPGATKFDGISMGFQSIAPGGRIRAHSHDSQVEMQVCFKGRGHVLANGERHQLVPGTTCFLGPDVVHEVINDGDEDLVQIWVISPAGLEDFFAAIGRERKPAEPSPEPFPRPDDSAAIDCQMGFGANSE